MHLYEHPWEGHQQWCIMKGEINGSKWLPVAEQRKGSTTGWWSDCNSRDFRVDFGWRQSKPFLRITLCHSCGWLQFRIHVARMLLKWKRYQPITGNRQLGQLGFSYFQFILWNNKKLTIRKSQTEILCNLFLCFSKIEDCNMEPNS